MGVLSDNLEQEPLTLGDFFEVKHFTLGAHSRLSCGLSTMFDAHMRIQMHLVCTPLEKLVDTEFWMALFKYTTFCPNEYKYELRFRHYSGKDTEPVLSIIMHYTTRTNKRYMQCELYLKPAEDTDPNIFENLINTSLHEYTV